jgi:hypothetical protein
MNTRELIKARLKNFGLLKYFHNTKILTDIEKGRFDNPDRTVKFRTEKKPILERII